MMKSLACGGTLLKHAANGDKIFWIIVTSIFPGQGYSEEWMENRNEEIQNIKDRIGIEKVFLLNYPSMQLSDETALKLIPEIGKIFNETQPDTVYVLNRSDAHSDHRITFQSVIACTKSFRYPYIKRVLMYECISETEFAAVLPENAFLPNYYVDITSFMSTKLELIQIYKSEIGQHPFPRSLENIKALAHFRGASVGVEYAEAFQLLKYIDK